MKKIGYIIRKILIYFLELYISLKAIPYFEIFGFAIVSFQVYFDIIVNIDKIRKQKRTSKLNEKTKRKKEMSQYEIERYAAVCNAYLEHQEEMKQYEDLTKHS